MRIITDRHAADVDRHLRHLEKAANADKVTIAALQSAEWNRTQELRAAQLDYDEVRKQLQLAHPHLAYLPTFGMLGLAKDSKSFGQALATIIHGARLQAANDARGAHS